MKRVEGNSDRQKYVEVRRVINDADPRDEPLEIFEQKVSVFEKAEHAEVHANARHQPDAARMLSFRLCDSRSEPEIHCRRGKEERGKGRVPRAVKNVAGADEQVFARVPGADAPVKCHYDSKKDDERQRIEKHELARFLSEKVSMVRAFFSNATSALTRPRCKTQPLLSWH
jgi:hypothetical protein